MFLCFSLVICLFFFFLSGGVTCPPGGFINSGWTRKCNLALSVMIEQLPCRSGLDEIYKAENLSSEIIVPMVLYSLNRSEVTIIPSILYLPRSKLIVTNYTPNGGMLLNYKESDGNRLTKRVLLCLRVTIGMDLWELFFDAKWWNKPTNIPIQFTNFWAKIDIDIIQKRKLK